MTELITKVFLGLPLTAVEKIDNADFELHTGDDFDDWTEYIPAYVELLDNIDLELVTGDNFDDWIEGRPGDADVEDEQVVVHGGNHSAKLTPPSAFPTLAALFYQSPGGTVGNTYTFAAWVKGVYNIWISEGGVNSTINSGIAAGWEYQTVTRTLESTTLAAGIQALGPNQANISYIDDATLYRDPGAIEVSTISHGGTHAVRMTGANTATQPHITQTFVVVAEKRHKLSFWTKGSSVDYEVYDVSNSAIIKAGTTTKNANYAETGHIFYTPVGCISMKVTITGIQGSVTYIDDVSMKEYGGISWIENEDVLATPAPVWEYGIKGTGPSDLVASTGMANFVLDNNSDTPGKYSPLHGSAIVGFEEGMPVKIVVDGPNIDPDWAQVADMEEGDLSDFDAVTPAWHKEVGFETANLSEFDDEVDADNDLQITSNAHDGLWGCKVLFDDNNLAYGTLNFSAPNQTTAVVSFWFNPNDVVITNGANIAIAYLEDPGISGNVPCYLRNNAGTYQIRWDVKTDTGWHVGSYVDISATTWINIKFFCAASSAPGADDGWYMTFIDDVLVDSGSGIDNDTRVWDVLNVGMRGTSSADFGGSYFFDTIKIDPVGAPMADMLADINGSYGMPIPIMDATPRYATFTEPDSETRISAETSFDPNLLTMGNGESFYIIYGVNFYVRLYYLVAGSRYQLQAFVVTDTGSENTGYINITDAPHHIRVVWVASKGVGANDGYLLIYVDDVLEETISSIDNDTKVIDAIGFGAIAGLDAGTYGIIHFGDCKWSPTIGWTKFIGSMYTIRPAAGLFDHPDTEVEAHDWIGYLAKQELGIHDIQATKRADEALTTILTEFPNQPEAKDFDTGDETFLAIFEGDNPTRSMASYFQKLCRNEQGRIFCQGDGTLVFEAGTTRPANTTSAFTLDGTMSELDVVFSASKIYNIIDLLVRLQTIDTAANQVLFKVGKGIPITAGQTITLICNYTDADTGQRVAGADVVTPVAAPHFGATQVPTDDGMHANLDDTDYVVGGGAVEVKLHNNHGATTGYLNEFTILGKRITEYDSITVTAKDEDSITQTGNKRFIERLDLHADPTTAETIAKTIVAKYAPSHISTCRIKVLANLSDSLAQALLEAEPSTRFTAIESVTGLSKDFFINTIGYQQIDTLLWVTIQGQEA